MTYPNPPVIEVTHHSAAVELVVNRTRLNEYTGVLPEDPRYWKAPELRSALELGLVTIQTAHVGPKIQPRRGGHHGT